MKNILVLGAGRSSPALIRRLLEEAALNDWFVVVADRDLELAQRRIAQHPRGSAVAFDANDESLLSRRIQASDVVVNLLDPRFQPKLAWECVHHGRHMVSVSYRDREVRLLDQDASRRGVLLLTEVGLDPGLDHMLAMEFIQKVRDRQGRVTAFRTYGSGIPAPESESNPLHYFITWHPRNVVMSAHAGAQYMEDGRIKIVPFHQVFHHTWAVDIPRVGTLEAYPNRDSLAYVETFDLQHAHTVIRGTLRHPGWSETWAQVVRLGLPNEALRIPNLSERSYRDIVQMFLPSKLDGSSIEQRLARYLQISPTGRIMENLRWLGLFSEEPTGCPGDTAANMLECLLQERLAPPPGARDMVVLNHQFDVEYPEEGIAERFIGNLLAFGETDGETAMAWTVGLPAAITVKLLLQGRFPLTGAQLPTHPTIYRPVLAALKEEGLNVTEEIQPLPSPNPPAEAP